MTEEAATLEVAYRTIKLPPLGTFIPRLQATFWALQRAKPGSGQADYPLLVPHGAEFEFVGPWGSYGVDEPGAACQWDGLANTQALIAGGHEHPAIAFIQSLKRDAGLPQLYMPSLREIKNLCANGCDAFDPEAAYWTSTQYSRNFAYSQHFGNGNTSLTTSASTGWAAAPGPSADLPLSP